MKSSLFSSALQIGRARKIPRTPRFRDVSPVSVRRSSGAIDIDTLRLATPRDIVRNEIHKLIFSFFLSFFSSFFLSPTNASEPILTGYDLFASCSSTSIADSQSKVARTFERFFLARFLPADSDLFGNTSRRGFPTVVCAVGYISIARSLGRTSGSSDF